MTEKCSINVQPVDGPPEGLSLTTRLALERTRGAYECTLMSWVRTGTSMITFGFAVYKFFQLEFTKAGIMPHAPLIQKTLLGPREFGLVLIGIGLLSILLGAFEQRRDLRALREVYPGLPQSGTRLIALVVGVLGILAFVGVIYRFRAPERVICNFVGIASVPGGEGRISRA